MTTSPASSGKLPLSSLPSASGQAGLSGALRSEWTKIRSVRSTYWTLLALLVVSIGLDALISAATASHLNNVPSDKVGFDATQVSLFAFAFLGQLILAVLGGLVITAEYSTGMIRTSLSVQPRRRTLYAAKAMVFAGVALVISFFTSFVAFFLGQALLSSTGISSTLSQPQVLRAVVGTALVVTLVGLFAFGLGAIFRHTAATIATAIGVMFVVPIIINLLPDNWRIEVVRWLPSSALDRISATLPGANPHMFGPWGQFAVTAVWAVAALAVGGFLFRKRDA
jgi:ABC-type transport system involved in multi-copper enzyme maturation permease subunit